MTKTGKPDYRVEYSEFLAYFTNRAFRDHFRNLALGCPTLSGLDQEVFDKLQENEVKRVNLIRIGVPVTAAIAVFIILFVESYVSSLHISKNVYSLVSIAIPVILPLLQLPYVYTVRRRSYEPYALRRIFIAIRTIERNADFWSDSMFRRRVAREIDRVAVAVEGIPYAFKGVAPEVRNQLFIASRNKAQAIRDLELSVMMPEPTTLTDLTNRLSDDLRLLAKGQWYELPDGTYRTKMSRLQIVLYAVGVAILAGGVIVIVIFAPRLGLVAPILVTILSATALALLNKIGLSVATIQTYTDAAAKIMPSSDLSGTQK